jgi:hypothetical protein
MIKRRLGRLALSGMCLWAAAASHAAGRNVACDADSAACAGTRAPVTESSRTTALVAPTVGDFVRTAAPAAPLSQDRIASPRVGDAAVRGDSQAATLADHEIYALLVATLVAVLSLSRRRNL